MEDQKGARLSASSLLAAWRDAILISKVFQHRDALESAKSRRLLLRTATNTPNVICVGSMASYEPALTTQVGKTSCEAGAAFAPQAFLSQYAPACGNLFTLALPHTRGATSYVKLNNVSPNHANLTRVSNSRGSGVSCARHAGCWQGVDKQGCMWLRVWRGDVDAGGTISEHAVRKCAPVNGVEFRDTEFARG